MQSVVEFEQSKHAEKPGKVAVEQIKLCSGTTTPKVKNIYIYIHYIYIQKKKRRKIGSEESPTGRT